MVRHMELILQWRSTLNLTSLKDPSDMAVFHYLDSLTVLKVLGLLSGFRLLDVGSGAGFPGMVLGMADDSLRISLLDRDPKKIVFLKHAARHVGLHGVVFLNVSLSDLFRQSHPPFFDAVVSRAFSSDETLLDSLHHIVGEGGFLVRMAGPASTGEAFHLAHFRQTRAWEGVLPFSSAFRRVILYAKISG